MAVTRLEVEALLSQGLPNTPMAGSYMRVTGGNFVVAKPVGVVDGVDYGFENAASARSHYGLCSRTLSPCLSPTRGEG